MFIEEKISYSLILLFKFQQYLFTTKATGRNSSIHDDLAEFMQLVKT